MKAKLSFSPYFLLLVFPSFIFGYLAVISLQAPILEKYFLYSISNYFYNVLSAMCHQFPSRSLWIVNRPMGLCSRCFAIYASFPIAIFFIPLFKKDKKNRSNLTAYKYINIITGLILVFHTNLYALLILFN